MITKSDNDRFQSGAQDYAAYLATTEGRLRTDLAFANLVDSLPPSHANTPKHALDIGCGTGLMAVRLAQLGFHVTQLDSSQAMLDIAARTADQAGIANQVKLLKSDAAELTELFPASSFDVVLCHYILEYVDDVSTVLRGAARALRNASSILSVIERNRAGEVLKSAIQAGELDSAEDNLTAEFGRESLYGGSVRLFSPSVLHEMLRAESLALVAERGVRVVADYLPPRISRDAEYSRIFRLERALGCRPEYAAVARYTQIIACRERSGI